MSDDFPVELPASFPSTVPRLPTQDEFRALEQEILTLPPVDCPVKHHFADGVYGREMFIPAGTVLTGKQHRFSTFNFLMKGDISVTTSEGVKRLSAPAIFVSPPESSKAGFAYTDVIWVNVHPTKLTDIAAIESKFIVPNDLGITEENCK